MQTLVRNFRPGSLWETLQPAHRSRAGRLVVYGIVCSLIALLPAVALITWQIYRWGVTTVPTPSVGELLDSAMREDMIRLVFAFGMIWALYPWLNFLALQVFYQSMRRARVKPVHALRCAIYCGDIIVWEALFELAALGWYLTRRQTLWRQEHLAMALLFSGMILVALNGVRLVFAYWQYMKFRHVIVTIFAVQLMVILGILAGFSVVQYTF